MSRGLRNRWPPLTQLEPKSRGGDGPWSGQRRSGSTAAGGVGAASSSSSAPAGNKPPLWDAKRPARPNKSAMQNGSPWGMARALNRPGRARTVRVGLECGLEFRLGLGLPAGI